MLTFHHPHHSAAVHLAVSGNNQFLAVPTLVSLIPLGVPLELKGALFNALAAFSVNQVLAFRVLKFVMLSGL
jgi:hypothetical protein